jgi:dUTP pyrophosphatase
MATKTPVAPVKLTAPDFPHLNPDRKGGENNPLTEADAAADLAGMPRPGTAGITLMPDEKVFAPGIPVAAPVPGNMQVKIKLLSSAAKVPTYGSDGAACFDLYAADTVAVAPGRAATIKTDVAFEVPEGYVMMIYSRSGHGFKHGVRLSNSTGVVDSDYRGHVPVRLHNDGRDTYVVEFGERVAQAMIVPVPRVEFQVVDELSPTERGENGFGSTGK